MIVIVTYHHKLKHYKKNYNHMLVLYILTIETLKPLDALGVSAKWKEIETLDIDFKSIAELEKYIQITTLQTEPPYNSNIHIDIENTDNLFWTLVDQYAELVIYIKIKSRLIKCPNSLLL